VLHLILANTLWTSWPWFVLVWLGGDQPGQKVDHFDSLNHDTFHQRYWENQRWWKVPTQAKAHPLAFRTALSLSLPRRSGVLRGHSSSAHL
jgi:hypothetical protein